MRLFTLPCLAAALLATAPVAVAQSAKNSPAAATVSSADRLAPPPNDDFANATVVTSAGEYLSSTIDATSQTGEAVATCGTPDSGQSVWYVFSANDTSPITLDLDGSIVAPPGPEGQFTDTIMSVYTGSTLAALAEVDCNDDDPDNSLPGDFTSRIEFTPTAGTRYYVRVTSYGNEDVSVRYNGEVRLTVTGNVSAPTAGESGASASASRLSVSPNPLTSAGQIALMAGSSQHVRVALYDVLGREVRVLSEAPVTAGQEMRVSLTTSDLPSGVYVVRATGTDLNLTQRVTVVR